MKVTSVSIEKDVKDLRELFKADTTHAKGYTLSNGKTVYEREMVYYGLKGFDNIEFPLFVIGLESLLEERFSLPSFYSFNKFVQSIFNISSMLEELGIIRKRKVDTAYPQFYK